jgi:hypothetical protein
MVKPGQRTALALSKCFKSFIFISSDSKYLTFGLKVIEVPVFLAPTSPTTLRSFFLSPLLNMFYINITSNDHSLFIN